jgi:hypothetical protein
MRPEKKGLGIFTFFRFLLEAQQGEPAKSFWTFRCSFTFGSDPTACWAWRKRNNDGSQLPSSEEEMMTDELGCEL